MTVSVNINGSIVLKIIPQGELDRIVLKELIGSKDIKVEETPGATNGEITITGKRDTSDSKA